MDTRRCNSESCKIAAVKRSAVLDAPLATILANPAKDWQRLAYGGIRIAKRVIDVDWKKFNQDNYVMAHCSIVCSCRVEENGFYIDPVCSELVNNNGNAWTNEVLLATFRTFVGGDVFLEHVQIPELSKGKILDAVIRPVTHKNAIGSADVYWVDILTATHRKHADLVRRITSGELTTLSMGCNANNVTCSKCGIVLTDDDKNCEHLDHELLQYFVDKNGVRRIVAELCVVPGTRVVMSDGTRKPIDDIVVGDMVLTHTGKKQEVVKKFERRHQGELVNIRVTGLPKTLSTTPNHPYLVISAEEFCACGCGRRMKTFDLPGARRFTIKYVAGHNPHRKIIDKAIHPEWKEAKDIRLGDMLLMPIPKAEITPSDANLNRAFLLGWFLAEGSYIKRKGVRVGIGFTLGKDELGFAQEIAKKLGEEFPPQPHKRTKKGKLSIPRARLRGWKAVVEYINDAATEWLYKHAGEYAATKRLSEEVMGWNVDLQKEFLSAYVSGDGTVDKLGRHSSSSVSIDIADQIAIIAARCGIWTRRQVIFDGKCVDICSVGSGLRDGMNFLQRFETHYQPSKETSDFFSMKGKPSFLRERAWRQHDGYMLYKVVQIGVSEYDGTVYNLAVNEDNSYLVEGVSVHNCGRTVKGKDGKLVGDPKSVQFIEASWVERPAFTGAVLNHYISEVPKLSSIMGFNHARLADCVEDLFKLRVADVQGMTVLRVARAEWIRRQREATIEKVAKSLYWAK